LAVVLGTGVTSADVSSPDILPMSAEGRESAIYMAKQRMKEDVGQVHLKNKMQ
jgi:hypothetical protein